MSLQPIIMLMKKQQFDAALQQLSLVHDELHAHPIVHARVHALWIICLWKKSGVKQKLSLFSFHLLALCFSIPVSLCEMALLKIKRQ